MKTATVRDLRNKYTQLLSWLAAGEEILITQRGKLIARLCPETTDQNSQVDWQKSAAVQRDRSQEQVLSVKESAQIRAEAGGRW